MLCEVPRIRMCDNTSGRLVYAINNAVLFAVGK
jgi:hypothetical protein